MRWKLFLGVIAVMVVVGGVNASQEPLQKVSPNNTGFTILPINQGGDPSGPPLLDPTVIAGPGPGAATAVPEPSTIAMLFLGSACAGTFTALRRRRRG